MGLKGKTKPGEMISAMNKMKTNSLKTPAKDVKINSIIKKII